MLYIISELSSEHSNISLGAEETSFPCVLVGVILRRVKAICLLPLMITIDIFHYQAVLLYQH